MILLFIGLRLEYRPVLFSIVVFQPQDVVLSWFLGLVSTVLSFMMADSAD